MYLNLIVNPNKRTVWIPQSIKFKYKIKKLIFCYTRFYIPEGFRRTKSTTCQKISLYTNTRQYFFDTSILLIVLKKKINCVFVEITKTLLRNKPEWNQSNDLKEDPLQTNGTGQKSFLGWGLRRRTIKRLVAGGYDEEPTFKGEQIRRKPPLGLESRGDILWGNVTTDIDNTTTTFFENDTKLFVVTYTKKKLFLSVSSIFSPLWYSQKVSDKLLHYILIRPTISHLCSRYDHIIERQQRSFLVDSESPYFVVFE